jgi:four helix bundle protein
VNYKRFEELPVWQKARELCREIYKLVTETDLKKDFSLKDQLWRSSGSVMDNTAEGFDDGSPKEFIRFLAYSQRSCSEVQSQLYRAIDAGYITQDQFDRVYNLAADCRKQIKGLRKYLREFDPNKFTRYN